MNRYAAGCVAGLVATLPMTLAMAEMRRRLPRTQRNALPPYEITKETMQQLGLNRHLNEAERRELALAAHFAYGTAAGGVYDLVEEMIPLPPSLRGLAFGLSVWASSYLGWLPTMDLYRHPKQEPPRRTALMIAAHVVWGVTLGALCDRLRPQKQRP